MTFRCVYFQRNICMRTHNASFTIECSICCQHFRFHFYFSVCFNSAYHIECEYVIQTLSYRWQSNDSMPFLLTSIEYSHVSHLKFESRCFRSGRFTERRKWFNSIEVKMSEYDKEIMENRSRQLEKIVRNEFIFIYLYIFSSQNKPNYQKLREYKKIFETFFTVK